MFTTKVVTGLFISLALLVLPGVAAAQTVTVTTAADTTDIDWQTATIADLPGPDGKVSFSEALIATNHTPGHQTIAFAIPQEEWILQFVLPGRAVLTALTGFFWHADETVTIDGTTQTAFTGDTNPDGHEVALYGNDLNLSGDNCTLIGFDSSSVSFGGSNCVIEGNTGSMNISVAGVGNLIKDNQGGTLGVSGADTVVVGNNVQRVRVLGGSGHRIGGPNPADRNIIWGYGTWNSEGIPSGQAIQLFNTQGVVIENNWIGTADGLTVGNLACTIGISVETQNADVLIKDNLISGIYGLGMGPHYPGTVWGRSLLASGNGSGLVITGNTIGLDINGDPLLGGAWGLDLGDPVTHKLFMTGIVVSDNEIGGHILNGVTVGRYTAAVRLSGNSIHDNGWLGIDLLGTSDISHGVSPNDALDQDTGGSGVQNFPELTGVMRVGAELRVQGSLHSSANDDFSVEFFGSPDCDDDGHGEGQLFLGGAAVSTDASGNVAFDLNLTEPLPEGWVVSATATLESLGATSEFSACASSVWHDEGHALAGVAGLPRLVGQGELSASSNNLITLSGSAPSALSGLFFSLSDNPTPFKGGLLVPQPLIVNPLMRTTLADGSSALRFVLPGDVPAGVELWLQWATVDAAAIQGVSLSNALMGRTN